MKTPIGEEWKQLGEATQHYNPESFATDLEAARKNLSQVQVAQAEEIRQVAARLQIRLAVFQNLKNAAGQNAN